jgi:Dolichyl-phosphate-mannose-protein mannosyltransferase
MAMNKNSILLLSFIVLKLILQYFAIDPVYDLHRDEYLHIDLGYHLAWGYSSVPPFTSWISLIIILLGKSVFWVKFFPAVFGALTLVIAWKIVEELGGQFYARILTATGIIFSLLLRINTLYQPNSPDIFFWTLTFYFIIKYIKSEDVKWLYATAISFAFGFLNKYNIAFMLLGLFPALLITRQRRLFTKKHFYYAILTALLLILPNLIWQYLNDFPVISHLSTLAETQLVNFRRSDFLTEQLLFFSGSLAVWLAAFVAYFRYEPVKKYVLFFWTYLFTIVVYLFFSAKGYYTLGLYPALIAFGSVYLEHLLQKGWLRFIKVLLIVSPLIVIWTVYPLILPVLSPAEIVKRNKEFKEMGLTRWEDGQDHLLPQDFADMLGWRELAVMVDSAFTQIEKKHYTLIHCDNYCQAGAINFYSKQPYSEALTMSSDYINWYDIEKLEFKNVVLVKEAHNEINLQRERALFDSIAYIGEIKNPYAREHGSRVYLLTKPRYSINDILEKELQNHH